MQSLKSIVVAVVALIVAGSAQAQAPEKKDVKLGVGGANSLYYLPLALTEKLGYFKEQGLNVEINDFKGGSQSLNALVAARSTSSPAPTSTPCACRPRARTIVAAIELGRYPGISLAVKKDRMDKIKTIADLKGAQASASPRRAPPPT